MERGRRLASAEEVECASLQEFMGNLLPPTSSRDFAGGSCWTQRFTHGCTARWPYIRARLTEWFRGGGPTDFLCRLSRTDGSTWNALGRI